MAGSRVYSADTENLLKGKGLKCICELCDCGGYHPHQGCTKYPDKMKAVFKRPGLANAKTDYQATYTVHEDSKPRHAKRPLPRLRNPHPPPMDFRTVHRLDFIGRTPEPQKSCKFMEEYKLPEEKLEGKTVYTQDFTDRGPRNVVKITRPQTVTQRNGVKFQSATCYNETFTAKVPVPQITYGELPSFTGSILFPDKKSKFDAKTWNQDVYRGKFARRADAFKPKEAQIQIGIEGDHDLCTVHNVTYVTPEIADKTDPSISQPTLKTQKRPKFLDETQAKRDFPGFGGKMPLPPKPVTPPPTTLKLAMNNKRDFETTNHQFYKITWDPSKMEKTKSLKPDDTEYTEPGAKFADTTITKQDFKQREAARMPRIRPPTRIEPSKANFFDETAYKAQFKPFEAAPFRRYGDFHETNVYLKPLVKFHQDGSVTTQDFKGAEGGRPSTCVKPEHKLEKVDAEMSGVTAYKEAYSRKKLPDCTYVQYINQRMAKKALATV